MGWAIPGNFPKEPMINTCPLKEGEVCTGKITNLNTTFRYGNVFIGDQFSSLIFIFCAIDGWPGSRKNDTPKKIEEKLRQLEHYGKNGVEIDTKVRVEIGRNWTARRIFPILTA